MNTLFGEVKSPLEFMRDLEYISKSHTFNRAVIASYNNLKRYKISFDDNLIIINRMKDTLAFNLNPEITDIKINSKKKVVLLDETLKRPGSKKITEVEYDLEQLFEKNTKQQRRAIRLNDRMTIDIHNLEDKHLAKDIFDAWKKNKVEDPKVFKIAFNPERYLRSYDLAELGYNMYQKAIFVNKKLYATINFSIEKDRAYELSFLSKYWDKELKIINDLNDCILLWCFHDLWKNYGIKQINVGTSAGIKGLKFFKNQFLHNELILYLTKL